MAFIRAGQATQLAICKRRPTTLCARVRSMELRPSFLKQRNPDFLSFTWCKRDSPILIYWQIVINHDRSPDSVDVEVHQVAACRVYLFSVEKMLDSFGFFGQRTQNRKEIAVPKCPLLNIVRINSIRENSDWIVDFASSFPRMLSETSTRIINFRIQNWFRARLKCWICPGLASCNNIVNESFRLLIYISLLIFGHLVAFFSGTVLSLRIFFIIKDRIYSKSLIFLGRFCNRLRIRASHTILK